MWWALDNVKVFDNTTSSIVNSEGGFENLNLNTSWTICNPSDSCFAGEISKEHAHTGNNSYLDGAIQNADYLIQSIPTVGGRLYQINFWLKNLGSNPNSATLIVGS